MPLLALYPQATRKLAFLTSTFVSGGLLLIIYTLYEWIVLGRSIYTGFAEKYLHDRLVFLAWLSFSISFFLLRRRDLSAHAFTRTGLMAISVGMFFISFAYFFNGWVDGVSFPGFVISYYPGTLIASLGFIICIAGKPKNPSNLHLPKTVLAGILLLMLLSCFLPIYFFSAKGDKATATIIRNTCLLLLGAAFIMLGLSMKKTNLVNND